MSDKPLTAAGYHPGDSDRARALCLHLAVALGDLMEEVVVVGGLVPSLLIPQDRLPSGAMTHAGTADLDLGLSLALFDHKRYRTLAEKMRRADFVPETNNEGHQIRQKWRHKDHAGIMTDFLVPPQSSGDRGGTIRNLEADLAAIIIPGLHLALQERISIRLNDTLPDGVRAEREISVCGPGAFVVLKALAFRERSERKDAYDLYYLLRYAEGGVADIARRILSFGTDPSAAKALDILREDFSEPDLVGPASVARFLNDRLDDVIQADASGFVRRLLDALSR